MYRKNLLTTTGKLPEKTNNFLLSVSLMNLKRKFALKGSRFPVAAFLLLFAVVWSGCESDGMVGEGLGPDPEEAQKVTVEPGELTSIEANTYSGRLQYSGLGEVDDPVYGNVRAVALLKPSISTTQLDTLREGDTMSLLLSFSSSVYGESGGASSFEVYEAESVWRGNELRYNREVDVDYNSFVGEFQVSDEDSIEVELSQEWVDRYREYHASGSSNRDSVYVNEFPGLAIVPAGNSSSVRFIRHVEEEDEEEETVFGVTRFLVRSADNGDEDENDEQITNLDLRDWGTSMIRSGEPEPQNSLVLHNTGQLLKIDPDLPIDELKGRNIVNAKLVFARNDEAEQASALQRPMPEMLRGHSFRDTPSDLVSELFINSPRFNGVYDEDEKLFTIDITQYVLNEVYGDQEEGAIYISLQSVSGIFYSAQLYDEDADDLRRPRIIITSVE
jgi:hypothetical protein